MAVDVIVWTGAIVAGVVAFVFVSFVMLVLFAVVSGVVEGVRQVRERGRRD